MDITKKFPSFPVLEPLDVTCTSSKCDLGLHCFRPTRKMKLEHEFGKCRTCGEDLIDWNRIYKRNADDFIYTFDSLTSELIRHVFYFADIDIKAENHAKRKGILGLEDATYNRIKKYVAPAIPVYDGRQTPKSGNLIYYAQHFTASCCRKCMEYWHNIPYGKELANNEIDYFTHLAMLFIKNKMPELTKNGEKVPPIKKN